MTRPRKQKVDWFPHSCTHGKTIFVLEKKYGLKGYVFWFKLLEMLGDTEGHYIDLNEPATKEFVQAYTSGDVDTDDILDLLASLDAIDREAWEAKIIWSTNFIKGISQTYLNRRVVPPSRPDIYIQKHTPGVVSTGKLHPIIQEGKGREGKGREVLKDIAPPNPSDVGGALKNIFFTCQFFDVDFDDRMKLAKEFPALTDELLREEFSKMEDWVKDNKHKKKYKANGHMLNPRAFIKNWLKKAEVDGKKLFPGPGGKSPPGGKPKGHAGLRAWAESRMPKPPPVDSEEPPPKPPPGGFHG